MGELGFAVPKATPSTDIVGLLQDAEVCSPVSESSSGAEDQDGAKAGSSSATERLDVRASTGIARSAEEWVRDDTTISLFSERFKRDTGPLSKGCPCHTCCHHTRAYIHHLLHVHEMLAQVIQAEFCSDTG